MNPVEPIPGEPAAIAHLDGEDALVVADYHAGIETALSYEGVELESRADDRLDHLVSLLDENDPERVVFLGDLAHWIGEPVGVELDELEEVIETVTDRVPATLVKGNHDGEVEDALDVEVTDGRGARLGRIGFSHGHTWPSTEVLEADVVCTAHEHPQVRLEDAVGGRRIERAWLRGDLAPNAFADHAEIDGIDGELVVFPAFNQLSGGTWVNVDGQSFLSPFLPDGLSNGQAYLLDGTRLGDYRRIT